MITILFYLFGCKIKEKESYGEAKGCRLIKKDVILQRFLTDTT